MRMRIQGPSMRFIDESKPRSEEVRDLEFGPENREQATHADICAWTAQEYDCWMTTGRRPHTADESEPNSRQKQIEQAEHFARVSDQRWNYRGGLTTDEMRGLSLSERFAAASAKMRASYDPFGRQADLRRRRSE
jgi:hypothetical protein